MPAKVKFDAERLARGMDLIEEGVLKTLDRKQRFRIARAGASVLSKGYKQAVRNAGYPQLARAVRTKRHRAKRAAAVLVGYNQRKAPHFPFPISGTVLRFSKRGKRRGSIERSINYAQLVSRLAPASLDAMAERTAEIVDAELNSIKSKVERI